MKARNIIPGWPRGRSTESASKWTMPRWFRYWDDPDADATEAYHAGQQAMVNAYFEQWRLQYPNPPRNEFYEHITQMAEAFLVGYC